MGKTMWTIAIVNDCMSREATLANWQAYKVLAELRLDLLLIQRECGVDV